MMQAYGISSPGHVLIPIEHIRAANALFVELDLQRDLVRTHEAENRLLRHEKGLYAATVREWEMRYHTQSELLRVTNVQVEQVVRLNMDLHREVQRQRRMTWGLGGAAIIILTLALLN